MAGRLTDFYGRKKILLVVAALFAITSLGTGAAPTFAFFIMARFIGGLAVGGASILFSPCMSPKFHRPHCEGAWEPSTKCRSSLASLSARYAINYLLRDVGTYRRWMFITRRDPLRALLRDAAFGT